MLRRDSDSVFPELNTVENMFVYNFKARAELLTIINHIAPQPFSGSSKERDFLRKLQSSSPDRALSSHPLDLLGLENIALSTQLIL